jgi:NAD(P)-dependent dehydrogenase (short-subunit alcohol dehydrogenase family)
MKDKIILITGATSGIGRAAALALARQGAHIILHGRDGRKVNAARQEIVSQTGNTAVDVVTANLSLLAETRRLAEQVLRRYQRLDVLINNAGMMMGRQREVTEEGYEATLAVNFLAPMLLTALLLPLLQKSPEGRIINVASSAHKESARTNFSDWQLEKGYSPMRAYGNAKLFLILATQRMAKLLRAEASTKSPADKERMPVTANTMHPGAVASNFSVESDLGPVLKVLGRLARRFFRTVEQGADTMVWLAESEEVRGASGFYFIDRKPAKVGKKYNTEENERRVWEYCKEELGVCFGAGC